MCGLRTIIAIIMLLTVTVKGNSFDSRLHSFGYDLTEPIEIAAGDTITADNCAENVVMQTFEFGVAPKKSGRHGWQMNLISESDTLNVSLTKTDSNFGDIDHSEGIRLVVRRNNNAVFDQTLSDDVSIDSRPNYLRADIFSDGIDISLGHNVLRLVARLPFTSFYHQAVITTSSDASVVRRLVAHKPAPLILPSGFDSIDEVNDAIARCNHPIAGIWEKLDESFDTACALIGGDYTIAIVPIAESGNETSAPDSGRMMQILYISGGKTNAKAWKPLMIKGSLKPTPFYSNFDLEWIDALGNAISEGANAYIDDNLLVLDFPLLNSRLRFGRLP